MSTKILKPSKTVEKYDAVTITRHVLPDGKHHCEDGPAIFCQYPFGVTTEDWLIEGKYHRYGGPAVITVDGTKNYLIHGKQVNGPVKNWLNERNYVWETMTDIEKWELELFMRAL